MRYLMRRLGTSARSVCKCRWRIDYRAGQPIHSKGRQASTRLTVEINSLATNKSYRRRAVTGRRWKPSVLLPLLLQRTEYWPVKCARP